MKHDTRSLVEVLDRVAEADGEEDRVTLRGVLDTLGGRSFGPLLLVAGLITLAPLVGDIPGVPTAMGVLVFITAAQVLLRRERLWFPELLLKRSVAREKLHRALGWLRRPAAFVDRFMRPRLSALVHGAGVHLIALMSLLVGVAMPPMELVPFSANGAGAVLTAFGMSLLVRDGVLALLGMGATLGILTVVVFVLA